jgi:O-antigen/teichoic acid export membrane protein
VSNLSRRDQGVAAAASVRFMAQSLVGTFAWDLSAKAAVLLTAFIAVRAFSPAGFGQYITLSAIALLAAALWDAGGSTLLTREFAAGRLSGRSAVTQVLRLRSRTFALWVVAFAAGVVIVTSGKAASPMSIFAFAGASLLSSAGMAPLAVLRARARFGLAGMSFAAGRWLTAALSAVALLPGSGGNGLEVLALALLAGEACTFALALLGASRLRVGDTSDQAGRASQLTLRNALPFGANSLLAVAYNRLDVIIVATLTTVTQVAAYAPASRIQDALYMIPSAVGVVTFTVIARTWPGRRGPEQTSRLVLQCIVGGLALTVPMAALGTIFAPQAIHFALGPAYASAVTPTRILIWFLPLAAVQAPLLAALGASGRAADTTKVFATAFGVSLFLHLTLDWWLGAAGAAVASLARDPAALVVALTLARRAGIVHTAGSWPGSGLRQKVREA